MDSAATAAPTASAMTTTTLYQNFTRVFLSGVNLERFIVYCCNAASMDNPDPISSTIVTVLSTPVSISMSDVGIRMFKTTTIAPIPYYLLDESQCEFIRGLMEQAVKQTVPCNISSGHDGGFLLRIPPPPQHVFVEKAQVSLCLTRAIHGANGYGDDSIKEKVLAILFQRISALAVIPSVAKPRNPST
jgi:hypothetical protein